MKKKITIVTSVLPYPLTSGGAQAQYNFIDQLREKYDFIIIFPENGINRIRNMRTLSSLWPEVSFYPYSYCRQLMNIGFLFSKIRRAFGLIFLKSTRRFKIERILGSYGCYIDKGFAQYVNEVIEESKSNILQVDFFYHIDLIKYINKDIRTIFVQHEIRYVRNKRMLNQLGLEADENKAYLKLKKKEICNLNLYDTVITLTELDAEELRSAGVTTNILVSPAAVNSSISEVKNWDGTISFVGAAYHGPNQEGIYWITQKVLPLIDWTEYPTCKFNIIGSGWHKDMIKFPKNLKVNMPGFIENLHEAVNGSIMLVPILSGSGMRMKILEGAAMGLPILTTSVGVEGLKFLNGRDCIIADDPLEFAKSLKMLLRNSKKRRELSINAQKTFSNFYSREKMAEIRNNIYENQ